MKKTKIILLGFFVVVTLAIVYRITQEVFISPITSQNQLTLASKGRDTSAEALKAKVADLCVSDFNAEAWDKRYTQLFKKEQIDASTASPDEILFHLLRFAKSGRNIKGNFFLTMSKATNNKDGLYDSFRAEILFAVQQIIFDDLNTGLQLAKYITTDLLKTPLTDDDSCRNENEKEEIREKSLKFYSQELNLEKKERHERDTVAYNGIPGRIQAMIPSIVVLERNRWNAEAKNSDDSKEKKKEFLEKKKKEELKLIQPLYRGLAAYFVEQFPGVSISKARVFAKKYVSNKFMLANSNGVIVDVAKIGQDADKIIIMSSQPFNENSFVPTPTSSINNFKAMTEGKNGIYYAIYPNSYSEVQWQLGGERFKLEINKIEVKKPETISNFAPDYNAFWKDKVLTGLIMVSSNFAAKASSKIVPYTAYYKDKGYHFQPEVIIENGKEWMQNIIESGELDYIVKEAHSFGNDRTFFSTSEKIRLRVGHKELGNGRSEVIYFSTPLPSAEDHILNKDMKQWMEVRESKSGGSLFYVNSSCNSMDQAKNEVPEISSWLYNTIAATSLTTTFSNSPESSKYPILEGIRNGWSYEQMRAKISKTPRYVKQGQNQFKFPDEPIYQKHLGHKPIHINLELFKYEKDGSLQLYFMQSDSDDDDDM